jgi:hypothetical protein
MVAATLWRSATGGARVLQQGEATGSVRRMERRRKTHRGGGALTEEGGDSSKSGGADMPPAVGDGQEAMGRKGARDAVEWERNGRRGKISPMAASPF